MVYVTLNTLCQIALFFSFGSKWTMRMAAVITKQRRVICWFMLSAIWNVTQSYNLLCLNQTGWLFRALQSAVSTLFSNCPAQMPPILMMALGQSFLMGRAVSLLSPESVALARLGVFIISPAGSCLRKALCLKEWPLYLKIQYNLFFP